MTSEDIKNYLQKIIHILDSNGKLIIKFERTKNYTFKYLYRITKKEVDEVLRTLDESDFNKKELSNNPNFLGRELYFFSPKRTYTALNGRKDTMKLYVKIDLRDDENMIIVLSFHEYNDFSEEED